MAKATDAADRIREVYDLGPDKRKEIGLKGRKWAMSDEAQFTADHQGKTFIDTTDDLFKTWEPRVAFEVIDTDEKTTKRIQRKVWQNCLETREGSRWSKRCYKCVVCAGGTVPEKINYAMN